MWIVPNLVVECVLWEFSGPQAITQVKKIDAFDGFQMEIDAYMVYLEVCLLKIAPDSPNSSFSSNNTTLLQKL